MAQKTKTFYMRFYSTECASDKMASKNLTQFLRKYSNGQHTYITPLVEFNDYSYRIKVCSDLNNTISGYFVTYRNELLTKGNMDTGDEEPLHFADNEAIIEKTYFMSYPSSSNSEIVIYQNSRFGRIHDLSSYILNLLKNENLDGGMYFNPIGKDDFDLENILKQKPSYVEYKLAKPRYKYKPDETEPKWEQSQFALMEDCNAGTFTAKLSTRSAAGLNKSKLKEMVESILDNPHARKCKIKLEDIDEPIDLFSDVLKAQFTVSLAANGTSGESYIFNNISALKSSYAKLLEKYIQ